MSRFFLVWGRPALGFTAGWAQEWPHHTALKAVFDQNLGLPSLGHVLGLRGRVLGEPCILNLIIVAPCSSSCGIASCAREGAARRSRAKLERSLNICLSLLEQLLAPLRISTIIKAKTCPARERFLLKACFFFRCL